MTADAPTSASVLRIARVNATYLVPHGHPASAAVRTRLDAIVTRELATTCARSLAPLCDGDDPSVWFIRRLDVDVAIDASWETNRIGQTWSRPLARVLWHTMGQGDEGENVLRFPDRASHLAQFLCDLAD